MADDKTLKALGERPAQDSPEKVAQQTQQSQASAAPQPQRRSAPGRAPLFRR